MHPTLPLPAPGPMALVDLGLPYPDSPLLVGLHNLSDGIIGLCYTVIAGTLVWLVYRGRHTIPFSGMLLAFGAFIVACGFGHFMHVLTAWDHGYWWLLAAAQAVTVVASLATAVLLPPLVPRALALIEAAQVSEQRKARLIRTNAELERKIAEREQSAAALRESEARFRGAFDHAPIGKALVALDGRWLQVNRSLCAILGYREAELLALSFQEITHPDDLKSDLDQLSQLVAGSIETYQLEKRYVHKQGHVVWALLSVALVRDEGGLPLYLVSQIQDVTARKIADLALERARASLEAAQALAHLGSWETDLVTGAVFWSDELYRILGYPPGAVPPSPDAFLRSVHPDDRATAEEGMRRHAEGHPGESTCRVIRPDGDVRVIYNRPQVVRDAAGRPVRLLGTAHDITDLSALEQRLTYQAHHDSLTGLPNRTLLLDRLGKAIHRARRGGAICAVLFLDLDRFKVVNDSLGHHAGDELLIAVGQRLQQCIRPEDTVSRFGGDEFVLLLEAVADVRDAIRVAERIIAALQLPFTVAGREVFVSTSIGITLSMADRDNPADLLRDADIALYRAKSEAKGRYEVFDRTLNAQASEQLQLETDLRRGLAGLDFALYYQPQVNLATGQIVGAEALVRWQHPERGLIPPDAFIPLAEETGLIRPLGRWVLAEACRHARAWRAPYPGALPPTVAVNLSTQEFLHPDLIQTVAAILHETGLEPRRLELEITEGGALGDATTTIATLQRLKGLGVRLSIDDFGTGYSSLAYLKRFPVDALKIDKTFVAGLNQNDGDSAIVRAVIAMAHALGLQVIAEGVETAEQAHRLRALGCTLAQGYLYARPMQADTLAALLAAGSTLPAGSRDIAGDNVCITRTRHAD